MAKAKSKIVVVCGPTATGKTAYAIKLAEEIGGEVISADSRQVYRGINLLSGKATKKEMAGIPHYLLDVADPRKEFSVADFKKLAEQKIREIVSRGKIPIICGGTGFYIDTVVYDTLLPEVKPNKELRKELSGKSTSELFTILKKLDSARANTIDQDNPVRLIRAIEIAQALGKVPKARKKKSPYEIEWVLLDMEDDVLKDRIHKRLLERINEGMLREAVKLHKPVKDGGYGVSYKRMEALGLECRSTALYLQKKISKDELIEELDKASWQYVKRQRTWFKRNKDITHK